MGLAFFVFLNKIKITNNKKIGAAAKIETGGDDQQVIFLLGLMYFTNGIF